MRFTTTLILLAISLSTFGVAEAKPRTFVIDEPPEIQSCNSSHFSLSYRCTAGEDQAVVAEGLYDFDSSNCDPSADHCSKYTTVPIETGLAGEEQGAIVVMINIKPQDCLAYHLQWAAVITGVEEQISVYAGYNSTYNGRLNSLAGESFSVSKYTASGALGCDLKVLNGTN